MEFEKYREYLISTWMKEYEAEHSTRDLMVSGWNMLLDEVFFSFDRERTWNEIYW